MKPSQVNIKNTTREHRQHVLIINGKDADDKTYNRVMNAQPKKSGKGCYQPKAFSFLK